MRYIIIGYAIQFAIQVLREAAQKTTTTIDDDLVDTIESNFDELRSIINKL